MKRFPFAVLLAVLPVAAHDFWIEPSSFFPSVASELSLRLRIGDDFVGEAYPRDEQLADRFVYVGEPGWQTVRGNEGDEPAGRANVGHDGLFIAGYSSHPLFFEVAPVDFEKYLFKEGLEHAVRTRHERGDRDRPGRELFSRCAKALITAGRGGTNGYDRSLGFRLEIIPDRNPLTLEAGGTLPVRMLFNQQPCSNLLLTAICTAAPTKRVMGRSDAAGRVELVLPTRGTWLLKTVHIFPAADPKRADWESLWATYIFSQP